MKTPISTRSDVASCLAPYGQMHFLSLAAKVGDGGKGDKRKAGQVGAADFGKPSGSPVAPHGHGVAA